MENNYFVETLKVTWESLFTASGNPSLLSIEDVCLIGIGIICTISTRRHMSRLAGARRLQPSAAQRLQQNLRQNQPGQVPPATPLSATLHVASPMPTTGLSRTRAASHAA